MMKVAMPGEWQFGELLNVSRPLVPIEVAEFFLGEESRQILAYIDSGRLEYAWDLRGAAGGRRSEVRIYWRSLLALVRGECVTLRAPLVYEEVIPAQWAAVRAVNLYRRWSCSQWLLARLIESGHLGVGRKSGRGPAGSPELPRANIIEFLTSRRMGAHLARKTRAAARPLECRRPGLPAAGILHRQPSGPCGVQAASLRLRGAVPADLPASPEPGDPRPKA